MSEQNGELAQCFRALRSLHRKLERCESRAERAVLRTEIRSEVKSLQGHRSEIASRAEEGDVSSRALLDLLDRGAARAAGDRREPDRQTME